jgi:hypothetical protein
MRIFLSFLLIILILPQTSFDNVLVRQINYSGLFTSYAEAQSTVFNTTWMFIIRFFLLHHRRALSQTMCGI